MVNQVIAEKSGIYDKNEGVYQNGNDIKNEEPEAKVKAKVNTYTKLNVCFLCGKPSTETCDECNLVGFCSEDHKKAHRQENFCFPFMVERDEGVGNYVVAVRDIEPLELILWDSPCALNGNGKNGRSPSMSSMPQTC